MADRKPLVQNAGQLEQLQSGDPLALESIQFDTSFAGSHAEGKMHWDTANGTVSIGMPGGVVELQVGEEMLVRCRNTTGSAIPNGAAVYITGQSGNKPLIALSKADAKATAIVFGVTTESIDNNANGYVNTFGLVRDIDTTGFAEGGFMFLSATTAGGMETTPAIAPNFKARVGYCLTVHAENGVMLCTPTVANTLNSLSDVEAGPGEDNEHLKWDSASGTWVFSPTHENFYNGIFRESFDATVASDGATVTMSLEQSGGGDLIMKFSDAETTLDCTDPVQTIALVAGTDAAPTNNFIYILQSDKILTRGTAWPSAEHIKVGYFFCPSATFVQDHGGCYVNQNWNDHLAGTDGQGHLTHITKKVRSLGATWASGVNPNGGTVSYYTIAAGSTEWISTVGVVDQMHSQAYPIKDMSSTDIAIVVNKTGAAYEHITDLFAITEDSTGTTITNNRYFSLIFWGVVNKTGEFAGLMVNLPGGFYVLQAEAETDTNGYDDYTIPREFQTDSGTYFLIARSVFQMGATWSHVGTTDLRGSTISGSVGGGGGGVTDHGALGGLTDDDHTQYDLTDGSRAWTGHHAAGSFNLTGLGSLTSGQITVTGNSITCSTSTISLDDDNLTTTGTITGKNLPVPAAADSVLISAIGGVAAWSAAGASQYLQSSAGGVVSWAAKPAGGSTPDPDNAEQVLISDGAASSAWETAGTDQVVGSDSAGVVGWQNAGWLEGGNDNNDFDQGKKEESGLVWTSLGAEVIGTEDYVQGMCHCGNGILLCGTWPLGNIGKSTDYGKTWVDVQRLGTETQIYTLCYCGNGIALAGSASGHVWKTTDYGESWSDIGKIISSEGKVFRLIHLGNGIVLAGCSPTGKIGRSTDYGDNWSDLGQQSSQGAIYSFANCGNGRALAGTGNGGLVLESDDWGATWSSTGQIGSETIIYSLKYLQFGKVIAGTYPNGKIAYSDDYGATWTASSQLFSQASIRNLGYIGGGVCLAGTGDGGLVLHSSDWGHTWASLGQFGGQTRIGEIEYCGSGIVVLGTYKSATGGYIFYSGDATKPENPSASDQVLVSDGVGTSSWLTAGNDEVLRSNGSGTVSWTTIDWPRMLTGNETVYVTKAGNDSTGTGAVGAPYLTIGRAIEHIGELWIGSDNLVSVSIGAGVFTESTLSLRHPFGVNVFFNGVAADDTASAAVTNITAASSYVSGIEYYDFDLTLTGKTAAVGDFIIVRTATGGTYPEMCLGCHEVIGWNGGTEKATVRCYIRASIGGILPSGAVTCAVSTMTTVVYSTSDVIKVDGPYHGGNWDDIVLTGDDGDKGVWVLNGATITLGNRCGTSGHDINLYAQNGSVLFADYTYHSKGITILCKTQNSSTVNLRDAFMTGGRNQAIYAFISSSVQCSGITVIGTGSTGILAYQQAFVNATSAVLSHGKSTGSQAYYAATGGGIDATSSTVTGYAANKSPASNPGNDEAYIVGP